MKLVDSTELENQAPITTDRQLVRIWELASQGKLDEATAEYDRIDDGDLKQRVASHFGSGGLLHKAASLGSGKSLEQIQSAPLPCADTTCGAEHYQLATALLVKGNKMAALHEYCLSASTRSPEVQSWREIGSLLAEAQSFFFSNVALARYCSMAPQALDFGTVYGKMLKLRSRHSKEILQTIAELETGNTRQIAFATTIPAATGVAATSTCKIQLQNCIAVMRTGLH